jgi:hypothetical protein
MRAINCILLILLFSCKGKESDSVKVVTSLPKCDTSCITLSFFNNMPVELNNGLMAIFYKGVEEDFTSAFQDTIRTYPLHGRNYLCLKKAELYFKYYAGPTDTIFGSVYQKGLGYSRVFDIVLSKNISHVNLEWGIDYLPGVPEEFIR